MAESIYNFNSMWYKVTVQGSRYLYLIAGLTGEKPTSDGFAKLDFRGPDAGAGEAPGIGARRGRLPAMKEKIPGRLFSGKYVFKLNLNK